VIFEDAYKRKNTEEIDGILVDFISLEDLKLNKLATGRNKDLDDLENLQ